MSTTYIWIGVYIIIVWIGTIWWKLKKKPKDYGWQYVLITPAILPVLIPLLLTGSVLYNISNIYKSPVSYLIFVITQLAFVIPATPQKISGLMFGEAAPEGVQIHWSHTGQVVVVLVSFVIFLVVHFLRKRRKETDILYQIVVLTFVLVVIFLFDVLIGQIIKSWWVIFAAIGSFIVGLYLDEFRKRYLMTSTAENEA